MSTATYHVFAKAPNYLDDRTLKTPIVASAGGVHDMGNLRLVPKTWSETAAERAVRPPTIAGLTPPRAYERLARAFAEDWADYRRSLKAARDQTERLKVVARREPTEAYARAFLQLSEHHPERDTAVRSLTWVCKAPSIAGSDDAVRFLKRRAAARLLNDYMDRSGLAECVDELAFASRPIPPLKTAERLIAESPHRSVRGKANLLAARLLSDTSVIGRDPTGAEIDRAMSHYRVVIADYADVSSDDGLTLGEHANRRIDILNGLIRVNTLAPEVVGTDLEGRPLSLAEHQGKIVVLVFWASWCGPCVAELPEVNSLSEQYAGEVVFVGVNADESRADALQVVEEQKVKWRSWFDTGGMIAKQWNVTSWPSITIVDARGVVQHKHVQVTQLDQLLWNLLREKRATK